MISKEFIDGEENVHIIKKDSKTRFRPAIYVLVKNINNKYLMILNNKSKKWEIPGGGLKVGEDLVKGGIRELKEEAGYNIKINSKLPFTIEKDLVYSRSKDIYEHGLNFFFLGELLSEIQGRQNLGEGEKILDIKFFSIDELKKIDIVFWQKNTLKKLIKYISK